MRDLSRLLAFFLVVAALGFVGWLWDVGDLIRPWLATTRLLDWFVGAACLVWFFILLKAPWDLYFRAAEVAFEQQRSQERNIAVPEDRRAYISGLQRKLGFLAIFSHLFSAALVTGVAWFSGGSVGYYFAVFYLVATVFRPAVAGYQYLRRKLGLLGEEVRYPREDILDLRQQLQQLENLAERQKDRADGAEESLRGLRQALDQERHARERQQQALQAQNQALQGQLEKLGREFENSISRLTDNQELIQGVRAFVRLIQQTREEPS